MALKNHKNGRNTAGSQHFGKRLSDLMLVHGLTAGKVAKRCGITAAVVRQWLRNKDCKTSAKSLICLAELFNVRARWIYNGQGDIALSIAGEYSPKELTRLYQLMDDEHQRFIVDIAVLLVARAGGK